MINFFKAAAASILALAGAVQAAVIGNQLAAGYLGSIKVQSTSPLTIQYSTSQPDDHNWVGIYPAAAGGPDDQKAVQAALKWAYTPGLVGTVTIPTDGLPGGGGDYKAYFLTRDGYLWMGAPVQFSLDKTYPAAISVAQGHPIRIQYNTSEPGAENWVGIYFASGGGPDNSSAGDYPAIRWAYAGDAQGAIEIPADGVGDGVYKAYFLASNGYRSLAAPRIFTQGNAVFPGALAVDYSQDAFTFRYTTQRPSDKNWIGVYAYGQGPDAQSQVGDALAWDWAKGSRGTLKVPADKLASGQYQAYLLANNGYTWLANLVAIHK